MLQMEYNADIRQQDELVAIGRPVEQQAAQEDAEYAEQMAFQVQLELMVRDIDGCAC